VILVDSNVPMYLVGADHPHKVDAQRVLERAIADGRKLVTDAESLQEILHRYAAIERRDAIQPCLAALLAVVDEVLPIEREDVLAARDLLLATRSLSARDAVHVAVMRRHGIEHIMSFHRGFDGVSRVTRLA
jgi:hypothetical protein